MRLPIFHVACSAARSAVRPKHRMIASLRSDNLPLNLHQQLLGFGQRDAQVGNITKIIRRLIAITSKLRD